MLLKNKYNIRFLFISNNRKYFQLKTNKNPVIQGIRALKVVLGPRKNWGKVSVE